MNEEVLAGGDVNVVVRVEDTVRRPTGRWSPAVHALLRHFESAGFDGADRRPAILISGLLAAFMLMLAAAYVLYRTTVREIALARQRPIS